MTCSSYTRAGRRNSLAGFMIMGGVSCLIVKWSICIVFPLLGKMAIAASFSIIYIHSTELFPTVLRNSGLGLCSCFARIGGVVSPMTSFAVILNKHWELDWYFSENSQFVTFVLELCDIVWAISTARSSSLKFRHVKYVVTWNAE